MNRKRNVSIFLQKVITAFLSSFLLSTGLTLLATSGSAGVDEGLAAFLMHIVIFMIYSAPVYVIGGIPFAYLADLLMNRSIRIRGYEYYAMGLIVYGFGGFLVMGLIAVLLSGGDGLRVSNDTRNFFLFGAAAAILYFHVFLLVRYWFRPRDKVLIK